MALWMVRAGAQGEREDLALEQGLAVIGWIEVPDLSRYRTREEILELLKEVYPEEKPNSIANQARQLWAFTNRIQIGDLVMLPLKRRPAIAIGRVTGPYAYRPDLPEDARHTRPVQWLRQDIPRSSFAQDLLYSLGAFLTVCQIERNDAEKRVQAVLKVGKDPRLAEPSPVPEVEAAITDLAQFARDQIVQYIGSKFKGHGLARLVTALLQAQGYHTYTSPPGPDGGVDILAGAGPMGLSSPRLCVQVKSSNQPVDVSTFRELQGTLHNVGAEQGLLISWSGFKASVYQEARQKFFQIRLWDSAQLVDNLLAHYDHLSEDIQAELPLKRIWTLVREE